MSIAKTKTTAGGKRQAKLAARQDHERREEAYWNAVKQCKDDALTLVVQLASRPDAEPQLRALAARFTSLKHPGYFG